MVKFRSKRQRQWPSRPNQQGPDTLLARLLRAVWAIHGDIGGDAQYYLEHYNDCTAPFSIQRDLLVPSDPEDFLDMVKRVKHGKDKTLSDIKKDILNQKPPPRWLAVSTADATRRAIDFAVNLWLMIDTDTWQEDQTLREHIELLFPKSASTVSPLPLPKDELIFNARKLYRVGGLEIVWTSLINQHLHLDKRNSTLTIFRHASLLHSNGGARTRLDIAATKTICPRLIVILSSNVYPDRFLIELAETIELLFPSTDSARRRWDRRIRGSADLDVEGGVACQTSRNLRSYVYWQDHLRIIQQYYENARPRKMRQWIYDTRYSSQQATFWFAMLAIVLTLLFGLVQSVTGILQLTSQ